MRGFGQFRRAVAGFGLAESGAILLIDFSGETEPVVLKVLQEDLVNGLRPAEVEEHAVEAANPPPRADLLELGQQPLQRAAGHRVTAERLPQHVPLRDEVLESQVEFLDQAAARLFEVGLDRGVE